MTIEHLPDVGVKIGEHLLKWGTPRSTVRDRLSGPFEASDSIIRMSDYLPGADDIVSRKDIYQDYLGTQVWFTLLYSKEDAFTEFELHDGDTFVVAGLALVFGENVDDKTDALRAAGHSVEVMDEEGILLIALKTNYASSDHMGGEGPGLAYIYCAEDITHLLEE